MVVVRGESRLGGEAVKDGCNPVPLGTMLASKSAEKHYIFATGSNSDHSPSFRPTSSRCRCTARSISSLTGVWYSRPMSLLLASQPARNNN